MNYKKPVVIVGAGLCGTMLAVRLAQRGFPVEVFEKRSDMRTSGVEGGRSINLALSDRGIKGLSLIGIADKIHPLIIPMNGRMIHPISGELVLQPYSVRQNECINSISRGGLNIALLDEAEKYPNLKLHFNQNCINADLTRGIAQFENTITQQKISIEGQTIIGTDGSGSAVRQSLFANSANLRFNFQQSFLEHGYKELHIPDINGEWQLYKNALHIWPRGSYMMIALPNLDGSFTVTLFFPFEGEFGFNSLNTHKKVIDFFNEKFPDAVPLMPNLAEDFFQNPTSVLGTIKCFPWAANDKALLMGDAAHAIVPFYGQGMNCSFEDVVVFDELLENYTDDLKGLFSAFQMARKLNTDAIADLAIDNFYEMRDHVANPLYIKKRKLELQLEQTYPNYFSKYAMVTFREDLPYAMAMDKGRRQDELLLQWCQKHEETDDLNSVMTFLSENM
ncbi:MAG: FAD-dependent monooxygenase [Saprospiraceae bacterium]|nr:FAD-dependent monooxygenase [Saprospiraceae bacterium]